MIIVIKDKSSFFPLSSSQKVSAMLAMIEREREKEKVV